MNAQLSDVEVPAQVTLRFSHPGDAAALEAVEEAAMCAELAHIFPPEKYPFPREVILERWTEEVNDADVRIVVAEQGGDVVGYCATRGDWLMHIGVSPDLRGKGLATALLTEARLAAPTTSLWLWVLEENHRARRFYAREGWELTGETTIMPFPPDPVAVKYRAPAWEDVQR